MRPRLLSIERHVIEYVPLDRIRPDPRNPRKHEARQIRALAKSIAEFNLNVALLIDDSGQLVAGHARYEAAKLLGLTEVAVIRLRHLDEARLRAFMVADNRLHDLSSWDRDNLASILLDLSGADLDFDIEATGFSVGEIDLMVVDEDSDPADDPGAEDPQGGLVVARLCGLSPAFSSRFE